MIMGENIILKTNKRYFQKVNHVFIVLNVRENKGNTKI